MKKINTLTINKMEKNKVIKILIEERKKATKHINELFNQLNKEKIKNKIQELINAQVNDPKTFNRTLRNEETTKKKHYL